MKLTAFALSVAIVLCGVDLPYLSDSLGLEIRKVSADTITEVATWAELRAAIEEQEDGKTIKLTDNLYLTSEDGPIDIYVTTGNSITIDLNGHSIDRNLNTPVANGYIFTIVNGTVNLEGDAGGSISGGYNSGNGGAIIVNRGATLNFLSGIIDYNRTARNGGAIYSEGTVNIDGGMIMSNTAGNRGGGICADAGSVNLLGGSVVYNDSAYEGGGIYAEQDASITVANSSVISVYSNHKTNDEDDINNVYLNPGQSITISSQPHAGSSISVMTPSLPSWGSPVTIATGATSDCSSCFVSDAGEDVTWDTSSHAIVLSEDYVSTWAGIQNAFDYAGPIEGYVVKLNNDITAGSSDSVLTVTHNVTLDLNGHTLSRGLSSGNAVADGGVIKVTGGTLTVRDSSETYGGTITGGNTTGRGGGIFVDNGAGLIFESGTISGNNAAYGGGVGLQFYANFLQQEGTITNNNATSGGGVFVDSDSTYTIASGAIVTGNTHGTLNSNVLLMNNSIHIADGFTGASIGVDSSRLDTEITTGFANYHNTVNFRSVFTSDENMCLSLSSNNEVYFANHTGLSETTWEWSGYSSARASHICSVCGYEADHADAVITGPSYDADLDKVVFTATATFGSNTVTDKKVTDTQPSLKPMAEPYVNVLTGRYTPGNIAHYELILDGNTYYFAVDGDHPGALLDDISLRYLTISDAGITGYTGPHKDHIYLPSFTDDVSSITTLGSADPFFDFTSGSGDVELIDRGNIKTVNAAAFDGVENLILSLYSSEAITINGAFDKHTLIRCYHSSELAEGEHADQNFTVHYIDQHNYEVTNTTWADDYSSAVLTITCQDNNCTDTKELVTTGITQTLNADNETFTITASAVSPFDGKTYEAELENVPSYVITLIHKIDDEGTPYQFRVPRARANDGYANKAVFKFSSLDLRQLAVPDYSEFDGWTNGSATYSHDYTVTITGNETFTVVWRTIWAQVAEALCPTPTPTPEPDPNQEPSADPEPEPEPVITDVTIKLYSNLIPSEGDRYLTIGENVNATIDMNGYTIDRCLTSPTVNGYVFRVDGSLVIKNGTVKGGYNSGNGGGFYVTGTLVAKENTTITRNRAQNGAGIYLEQGTEDDKTIGIMYCGWITYNDAVERGGGVYVSPYANFTITTVESDVPDAQTRTRNLRGPNDAAVIENNTAGVEGGGVYINPTGHTHLNGNPQVVNNTSAGNRFDNILPAASSASEMAGMLSFGKALGAGALFGLSVKQLAIYGGFILLAIAAVGITTYCLLDSGKRKTPEGQRGECDHPYGHSNVFWQWNSDYTEVQATLSCELCGHTLIHRSPDLVNITTSVDNKTKVTTYTATTSDGINTYTSERAVAPFRVTIINDEDKASKTFLLAHLKDKNAEYTFSRYTFSTTDPHKTPKNCVAENGQTEYQFGETIEIDSDKRFTFKWNTTYILVYSPGCDDAIDHGQRPQIAEDDKFKLDKCRYYRQYYVFDTWSVAPADNPSDVSTRAPGEEIEDVKGDWTATALWKTEWVDLNNKLAEETGTPYSYTHTLYAMPEDTNLTMPANFTAIVDLSNTNSLDRNLTSYVAGGNALTVLGNITLTNGSITGGRNLGNGGGILVNNGATLTLSNFAINYNGCSNGHGGGVYVSNNSTVNVSGLVTIMDNTCVSLTENVYLNTGAVLNITGALDANTRIGISMKTPGVFTSGLSNKGSVDNFVSDDPEYEVKINEAGEAYLVLKETPVFAGGHALQLNGQVGLQFFVELPEGKTLSDYTDCYVTFSGNKIDSSVEYPLPATTSNKTASESYMVQIDLSSIQMADEITPTLHYTEDGVAHEVTGVAYSIQDYILAYVADHGTETESKELAIVKALADYGYYAQQYLSEYNGWTIGVDYESMDTRYSSSYDVDTIKAEVEKYAISKGTNDEITDVIYLLQFGSQISIHVYFTTADGVTVNTVEVDGKPANVSLNNGTYCVIINEIFATQLTVDHTITVNGVTTTVSPMSYVRDMLNYTEAGYSGQNAVCALYNYAIACQEGGNQ